MLPVQANVVAVRAARTATTLAWTGSTLACGLAVIAAPVIASWSHAPSARLPMQILALGVLVDGIAAVPGAMLTRNFQQKRRTTADFASLIASVGLSIGLALAGAGIWALVLGRLVGNVMGTIAVVVVAPSRPRPGWNRDDARTLLHFGLPLVGASALVFVMANLDTIVIARGLGAGAALGFHALAFNLSSWPINVLSGMLRRVSLPLFASHQHNDEQLTSSVLGTVQLVGAVAALPAMLLGALALWIITVVYGEKWTPAAAPLTFLAALGWVRVLGELAWDALIANGRTRRVLAVQGAWTLILAPALIVGVQLDGIRGAAIAHTAVALVVVIPAFALALRRMGATPGALARRVIRPVTSALVIGGGAWGAATWISGPAWLVVVIVGPTSALLFAALVWRPSSVRAGWRDILGRPEELQTTG